MMKLTVLLTIMLQLWATTTAFQVTPMSRSISTIGRTTGLMVSKEDDTAAPFFASYEETDAPAPAAADTAKSLERKMAKWEATEEEVKAASLGGITPGKERKDGFDLGLYVAFPFMIVGSLMFALFPLIMDKIDVSSVGPPPMM